MPTLRKKFLEEGNRNVENIEEHSEATRFIFLSDSAHISVLSSRQLARNQQDPQHYLQYLQTIKTHVSARLPNTEISSHLNVSLKLLNEQTSLSQA